mmetsp:Transcript_27680/g.64561  ORF Transcript_27680/g.64561 Transcript_27680/m.64561 type:complete len:209 (-) Transcript_27680:7-633(-)
MGAHVFRAGGLAEHQADESGLLGSAPFRFHRRLHWECRCGQGLATSASFTVLLPRGRHFRSGALNLTSRCRLQIEGTLVASTDPAHYPVVRALPSYGGCRDAGYPPEHFQFRHQALLSAWNVSDATVDGGGMGTVDGQGLVKDMRLGTSWAERFRAKALDFGRPRLWEPMFSERVVLQNIRLTNQAFWAVHPFASTDVYIGSAVAGKG